MVNISQTLALIAAAASTAIACEGQNHGNGQHDVGHAWSLPGTLPQGQHDGGYQQGQHDGGYQQGKGWQGETPPPPPPPPHHYDPSYCPCAQSGPPAPPSGPGAPPSGSPAPPYGHPTPPSGPYAPPSGPGAPPSGPPAPPYRQPAPPSGPPAPPSGPGAPPSGPPSPPYGHPAPPSGPPAPPSGPPAPPSPPYSRPPHSGNYTSPTHTSTPPVSTTGSAAPKFTRRVIAGFNGLHFEPENIVADVGDLIEVHYLPMNHSFAQSSFAEPCKPINDDAIFSGFMPTKSGEAPNVFTFEVKDTKPMWFYCSQTKGNHCQMGMSLVINEKSDGPNTLAAYKAASAKTGVSISPPKPGNGGKVAPPPDGPFASI